MWRRVEIWYRTFLSCILLWPFCLVFALATGEYLILVLPGALTALLFIYRPPVYWRDYLPRLGRLVDSIRAKKE